MFSALGANRALVVSVLCLAFSVSCGARWIPANTAEVPAQADAGANYAAVVAVAGSDKYTVVSQDEAAKKLRLQAKSNKKSFIDVEVVANEVKLSPAGELYRDGKVHKVLAHEIDNFSADLKQRFGTGGAQVASAPATTSQPAADTSGAPVAWTEPAYDPSVWGNGNFTCLPVRVPADHQGALTLQLTNGEKADLQLSLAYDPGLCRSPAQCKQPGGCPALGIGDSERVNRLAGRLSRGEVGNNAILLDSGKPVATIDLSHHGSIVQALSEIKH